MGCDIHLVLEKKFEDEWVGLHNFSWDILFATSAKGFEVTFPARDRNYELFAALAGVRGDGPEARGLPDDASLLTRMELGDTDDLHSHTWYSLEEALAIFMQVYEEIPAAVAAKLTGDKQDKSPLTKYFGLRDSESLDQYRLCIAFDN